jgi:hypothetical protein
MKLHNPFSFDQSMSLIVSMVIVLLVVLAVLVNVFAFFPKIFLGIILVSAFVRVIYAVLKGK